MTSIATRPNPFPGLRPFEANEDHLFFGRDGQSDEILGRLRRNRFLAVVGTSGSGKSSLIRAGLLPSLYGGLMTKAGSNWRIAVFRPGNDAIRNLTSALSAPGVLGRDGADALQTIFTETTLRRSALGLIDATRHARMPAEDNLLIVVDQFEELFRFRRTGSRPDDEAAAFVKLLLEATRQTEVPIYVVITMRSDFIGDCARFRDLPETVNEGLYLIPRMTRDQRREAITGPIAVGGAQITPRLVNRLLNDVGDSPDQLPILQHALMRTWSNWSHESDGSEPIDLKHYEAIGGMAEALSRHADRAFNELPDERSKAIAEKLFKRLTEKGPDNREVRRPTSMAEICAVAEAQESEVIAVIEPFRRSGRSFLMPPSTVPLNADSLIDISHESLIRNWDRLRGWVEAEALSATIYRRVADTAVLYSEGHAGLWRDPDLQVALGWREAAAPNAAWAERYHPAFDAAMRFLDESRAARDAHVLRREMLRRRELRRTRAFAFVLGVALLIASGAWFYAMSANREAAANFQDAIKQKQKAEAAVEQAQIAEREAEKNAASAKSNLKVAQEQTKLAQQKTTEAVQARQGLARQKIIAETKRQEAELLAEKLRLVALRMRTQNLHDNQTINTLADKLIETSSPEQALRWRRSKAVALSKIGDHDGAILEATVALDTNPNYLFARFGRGSDYLLAGKPEKAIKDTSDYLKSDPESTTGYLNLALGQAMQTQAMRTKYDDATSSIRQALDKFVYSNSESFDTEVSPDITRATGQVVIYAGGDALKVALYCELANLSASEGGGNNFERTLSDTDRSVSELRVKRSTGGVKSDAEMLDGYLAAINWAWLHMRVAPDDYGALVSQGALYERASSIQRDFKEWAWRSYKKFMQKYHKDPQSRYDELAKWSAKRMAKLYRQDPPAELPEEKPNARKLALEAAELEERKHWDGAHEVINRAITLEPDNVDLLIQRVSLRYEKKDYAGVREDCERILCLAERTPEANEYLALLPSSSDSQKLEYFEKALRYNPLSRDALNGLAILSEKSDPRKALEYVERAIGVSPDDSLLYWRKAQLQNQVGLAQAALESIEHAIALKQDNTDFYDLREKIERKLGRSEAEVVVGKAAGYREAGDAMLRLGKTADALNTYLKGIEMQGPFLNASEEARSEAMVAVRRISRLVGSQSSKEKARAFWETVKLSGYLKGAAQVLEKEIMRLSNAP